MTVIDEVINGSSELDSYGFVNTHTFTGIRFEKHIVILLLVCVPAFSEPVSHKPFFCRLFGVNIFHSYNLLPDLLIMQSLQLQLKLCSHVGSFLIETPVEESKSFNC
jgi:hypothetical protein